MNEDLEAKLLRRRKEYWQSGLAGYIQDEMKPAIKDLDNEVRMLPRIGPDGQSECPFAAQLYEQKERKAAKVAEILTTMRRKLKAIDEEITLYLHNLRIAEEAAAEIHGEATSQNAVYVVSVVKENLASAQNDSKMAKEAIAELERVLMYSEKIRHPDVPSVGVPAWSPEDRKKNDKRKSAPAASAPKPPSNPMPLPAPIPAGQSLGQNKGSVPLPPPIPIPPPMRRDSGKPLIPPPIPHPIGGTDMLLKPPKGAIHL